MSRKGRGSCAVLPDDFTGDSLLPLRPVLVCAILFWVIFRLVTFYLAYTSTFDWFVWIWQQPPPGTISIMGSMKWVSGTFVFVSLIELLTNSKNTGCRISFAFCSLMALHVFVMDLHMEDLKKSLLMD